MSRLNVDQIYTRSGTGSPIIREMPAFRVHLNTSQSVSAGVWTKVTLNEKSSADSFDTDNWFDTTNNKYTPQIPGYYQFDGLIRCGGASKTTEGAEIWKNGAKVAAGNLSRQSTNDSVNVSIHCLIYLNGTTDYIELYGFNNGTGPTFIGGATIPDSTLLSGFLVRAD